GVVISARPLNVRTGAGLTFPILGQLQPCTQPLLTGNRSADGLWVEVLSDNGAIGWVLSQYLSTADQPAPGVG
ncbi:MAG: SH3 domain-containing protein, partial [Candidatus Promineofilum sp.]|nr:SH3 domain-containing protein [Promineifilum sp.]